VANGGAGDSSVLTALGVFQGMRAAAARAWGEPSLAGRTVGIEGVGKVGRRLAGHLAGDSARIVICDTSAAAIERTRAEQPGVTVVPGRAELLASGLDVFAPCAMGGSVDDDAIAALGAGTRGVTIICGGANNQLARPGLHKLLADRGICYAPDYVVNAGGVIQVADELGGFSFDRARARAEQIYDTVTRLLAAADAEGVPPEVAADRMAEHRIQSVGRLRSVYLRGR
jgi:valine dehydrogenase (NAD+)